MDCKGKFDSEELLVLLVVVDNNSGAVVEYTEFVVCIGMVDSEVWNIGISCFADIWVASMSFLDFGL
ncbi:hypothetical protein G9A89_002459 [Geosiphon pyriformis]|nr:hypothetical protein G9A89_002459 [Geosiphon pyriformis]